MTWAMAARTHDVATLRRVDLRITAAQMDAAMLKDDSASPDSDAIETTTETSHGLITFEMVRDAENPSRNRSRLGDLNPDLRITSRSPPP